MRAMNPIDSTPTINESTITCIVTGGKVDGVRVEGRGLRVEG